VSAFFNVAGVKLHPRGRTLACDAGELDLRQGEEVVVDDGREAEVGRVAIPSARRAADGPLPRILRRANDTDRARVEAAARRTADALVFARTRAAAHKLPIKIFRAELQRGGRLQVSFASETRVDFRELVRDLAGHFHCRIEMRQVGVRDEAKVVGGIGSCGRELCCSTFLPKFAPVSIKMAKNQNLALSPAKVSGQCGRLKCCLVYEDPVYQEAAATLPRIGRRVTTPDGIGRVGDLDVLRGRIRVYFEGQPSKVFAADEIGAAPPSPPANPPRTSGH
jgi:cell fate regulator YaaT (PSP1 superfamily)